jgi:hypothetical protein
MECQWFSTAQNLSKSIKTFLNHTAIDILLVSEVHFTDRSFFKITHAYFNNHPDNTAHVGSGILITSIITHHELTKFGKTSYKLQQSR